MNKLLAVLAIAGAAITLSACEDADKSKEQAKAQAQEAKEEIVSAWNKTVDEVKEASADLHAEFADESFSEQVDELLAETKALASAASEEGKIQFNSLVADSKELAAQAWEESKEGAGELSDETINQIEALKEKIRAAREKLEENQ
ncbi:hypothetical protein AAEU32_03640 [Pseudoalteromonas sp. SSDWG2]|uniref:hypothetical protein n=1 Tax=Pseudoalteromonas sp. SSDWG2 TaxID=3139391 RepID=UPI003BAAAB79